MSIKFDGRVAIVTGAGRGMGREMALSLARRGAKVVVNDYGGSKTTLENGSIDVAQSVVDEIRGVGGDAVAQGSSVGTGESAGEIVGAALEAFGRVDILINNAGGNVVGPIDAHDDELIEGVIRTNFLGAYMLLRRVWPHMKSAGYGRIVNISSGALLGLPNNAAYSPSKAALIGLTNLANVEGRPLGILTNSVFPVGTTRQSDTMEPGPLKTWMTNFPPHFVGEAVAFLCSDQCDASGEIYSIGGGRVARNAIYNTVGFHDPNLTAESLAANFAQARDMTGATLIASTHEENTRYFDIVPWPDEVVSDG